MDGQQDLESIFSAALELVGTDRQSYLDQACRHDPSLRREVELLIASHERPGRFLEDPVVEVDLTIDLDSSVRLSSLLNDMSGRSVLESLRHHMNGTPRLDLCSPEEVGDPIIRTRSEELPPTASRYQILGEIARGGMGAVFRGRDTDLGRDLAIKVLLDAHKGKPQMVQRFVEEAQIGGQLQHPGIAPVHELGQFADQRPYFTMKLVKGKTLAALLSERRDSSDDRPRFLGIFERVCQTMAYAHSRGVMHRDLKPANIMVGAFGEVQVMDWGLAKVLGQGGVADEKKAHEKQAGFSIVETMRSAGSKTPDGYGSNTQMGTTMGTPAYMSPEQALGEIDRLDERVDVFGLGSVLCEILTGSPAYVARDLKQVYRMACRGNLDECFARLEKSRADDELLEIVRDSLAVDPDDRPRNANVLSERVTTYLESVEKRLRQAELDRLEADTRFAEERKRRRVIVAAASVIVFTLAFGVAGTVVGLIASQLSAADARRSEQDATANARMLERQVYAIRLANADSALRERNFVRARQELEACPATLRSWEWSYLKRRLEAVVSRAIPGCENPVYAAGGTRLVGIGIAGTEHEAKARVWHTSSGALIEEFVHDRRLHSIALSKDERYLAAGDRDGVLVLWDFVTKQALWTLKKHEARFDGLAFSPDGEILATAGWDGKTQLVETQSGATRFEVSFEEDHVRKVSFSPDGRWLAVGSSPAVLLDVSTGKVAATFPGEERVRVPTFGRSSDLIASGGSDFGDVVVWSWDGERLEQEDRLAGPQGSGLVWDLGFNVDGAHLAVVSEERGFMTVTVWDLQETRRLNSLPAVNAVYWIAMRPDKPEIAVLADHTSFRLWNYLEGDVGGVSVPSGKPRFSPDGRSVAIASDGQVTILDSDSGSILRTMEGDLLRDPWFPDSVRIAVARSPNVLEIHDVRTVREPRRLIGKETSPETHWFLADDGRRAISKTGATIRAWDTKSGQPILEFASDATTGREGMSLRGSRLAITADHVITVWDTEIGVITHQLRLPGRLWNKIRLSPDGTRLAVGSNGGMLTLHDIESGSELERFSGHGHVSEMDFSPDGTQLWVIDGRGLGVVWDVEAAYPLLVLKHGQVDWSPDGRRVYVKTAEGGARILSFPSDVDRSGGDGSLRERPANERR